MATKLGIKKYACSYCGKIYPDVVKADNCRDSHDLLYLMLSGDDLNRLHNYIYSGDKKLLTESLVTAIKGLVRRATIGKTED